MIGLRAGPDLLREIDAFAAAEGLSRSEAIRRLVEKALKSP